MSRWNGNDGLIMRIFVLQKLTKSRLPERIRIRKYDKRWKFYQFAFLFWPAFTYRILSERSINILLLSTNPSDKFDLLTKTRPFRVLSSIYILHNNKLHSFPNFLWFANGTDLNNIHFNIISLHIKLYKVVGPFDLLKSFTYEHLQ